jgi:hypothetical protein
VYAWSNLTARCTNRGTTYGNKETFAAAVEAVDPKEAEKVRKEKDWRHQYPK